MVTSCVKFNGDIPKVYRKLLGAYKVNDTIYFKSNLKDYDTIRISSIDSFSTGQGPDNLPFKQIHIRVEYLPYNKWHEGGYLLGNKSGKYDSIENQKFISIIKTQKPKATNYSVAVSYRSSSELLDFKKLSKQKFDTLFFDNKTNNNENITESYWSIDKGMVGYKKKEGQVYKLVE